MSPRLVSHFTCILSRFVHQISKRRERVGSVYAGSIPISRPVPGGELLLVKQAVNIEWDQKREGGPGDVRAQRQRQGEPGQIRRLAEYMGWRTTS